MLIKCPECGKDISDKAPACIYCGFPLHLLQQTQSTNSYNIKLECFDKSNKPIILKEIRIITQLKLSEAGKIIDNHDYIKTNISLEEANQIKTQIEKIGGKVSITKVSDNTVAYDTEEHRKSINVPYCPKCGSTHIEATTRGYDGFWGFLGSGQTMNYCKNCGNKWNP